jgi:hypothetical protein
VQEKKKKRKRKKRKKNEKLLCLEEGWLADQEPGGRTCPAAASRWCPLLPAPGIAPAHVSEQPKKGKIPPARQ